MNDEANVPAAGLATVDLEQLDLAQIESDLVGVEAALVRLDDGTYWSDEITGDELDERLLATDPVARRNAG